MLENSQVDKGTERGSPLCIHPYADDGEVEQVPDGLEVVVLVLLHLQGLLHDVVEDEAHEDDLAGQDEVVPGGHVAQELDSPEARGGQDAASGRELEGNPVTGGGSDRLHYL